MSRIINKSVSLIIVLALLSALFSACINFAGRQDSSYVSYNSYRDVPGVTEKEIEAIGILREQYSYFIYAMPASIEAFLNENGETRGFAALVCEWLTELFDIPFIPEIRPFAQVLSGFESGEIDFTGTMTPTEERLKIYHMTDPIAYRTLKYFMLRDSEPLSVIRASRLPRFALLEGSSVAANVMAALEPGSFEAVFIENNSVVYSMLKNGEIDAFIHENSTEAIFDAYTDVVATDFLPLIVSPVSLTALNPELEPIISVVQKAIEHGGIRYLTELYNKGQQEYRRHKLFAHLTDEERDFIQNAPIIRFAAEHDNYPISFYNTHDREFQGIAHDAIKEAVALTGLRFELANDRSTDWAEIFIMLEKGEVSMVTELIRTPEREGRFLWPETAIATDRHALLSKIEKDSININEILYLRVGVAAGYAHTELFNQWFPYHRFTTVFDNYDQAFSAMEQNKIDVIMGSQNKLLVRTNFLGQPGYKVNLVFDYLYESTFGFNKDEAILCSIMDKTLRFVDTNDIEDQWTRRTYDYRVQLAQQQFFWIISAVLLIMCIIFVVAVLFNISKGKKRVEKESSFKSQFLAMMSHEIRTPMNAVIGIAQIELQTGDLSERTAVALKKIYDSGNGLLGIINDILDMSKIETGKLELNLTEYNIPNLINDTLMLNIMRIGTKPLELILEIDENLPITLYGDELRLKQILNNLLSNAVKYTEKGFVKLSVRSLDVSDDEVITLIFALEDTGQGIKEEDLKFLFTEYQRFNTATNRTTEGTGLGLSIAKRLVELMNGTIGVESEYGKGSIFTVTIRQKVRNNTPIGYEVGEKLRNFAFTNERQMEHISRVPMPYGKVLIVDDVDTNLFVAQGLLLPYKLNIETVTSGFAVLDKINDGEMYDIVFMDHMMPEMDGIETTKKLHTLGYTGTIVALTANALVGNDEMFMQNGFDGFLPKPIDARRLNDVLNKFIRDKYPEEAKKYKSEIEAAEYMRTIDSNLFRVFRRDAEKTVVTLRETAANGDLKLFATTAHAMKSALANIGEHEVSKAASTLEEAGLKNDSKFIAANTESFIKTLETLINKLNPDIISDEDDTKIAEDVVYLREQIEIVITACEEYDNNTAYAALDRLKENIWKSKTSASIENIRDVLFSSSDFDVAIEICKSLLNEE